MTCADVTLEIAGLGISIHSEVPLAGRILPPEYDAFRLSSGPFRSPALNVTLHPASVAPAPDGGVHSGQWTWFREGLRRHVVWHADQRERPHWDASFELDGMNVRVDCGPTQWRDTPAGRQLSNPFRYPLDQLVLMYALASRGGVILHAAGLVTESAGIVAVGRSGVGKSTLSRLWQSRHGPTTVVSDDRVILIPAEGESQGGGRYTVHGTPWPGDLGAARRHSEVLKALVLLVQAPANRLTRLAPRQAMERLLPMASIPWFDTDLVPLALAVCEGITQVVPVYEFCFVPGPSAVDVATGLLGN